MVQVTSMEYNFLNFSNKNNQVLLILRQTNSRGFEKNIFLSFFLKGILPSFIVTNDEICHW